MSTTVIPTENPVASALRDKSEQLIDLEVQALRARAELEQDIRGYANAGVPIDLISEASGLSPAEIHKIAGTENGWN